MKHLRTSNALLALLATGALWGCTTSQAGVTPNITTGPLGGTLELAVGTVNFGGVDAGLNVVETFRGSNGFTAVPINTATLSGPGGFLGLAGSADPGADLAAVPLGSASNFFVVGNNSTDLASADGFGIGPPGTSQTFANGFPAQPQFGDVGAGGGLFGGEVPFYGAPPAFPAQSGGVIPGFPEMFYLLDLGGAPPTGSYTLLVSFSQNGVSKSTSTSASLASNALLPTMAAPSYTADINNDGGGTVNVTNPAGVTESLVNITDTTSGALSTVVTHGSGPQTATVPAGTFTAGDSLTLQAFGFDYPDVELVLSSPGPNPTLPASADVTISAQAGGTALKAHHIHMRAIPRH